MVRRLAGGVLVALGLVAASLAWIGYAAGRTVLDSGRSEAMADELFEDREVREQLKSSLASGLDALIPEGVQVSHTELVSAAEAALDDPAVKALVVEGLVRSHQRFLGEDPAPDEPIVVDAAALAAAGRAALVNMRPELADEVGVPPSLPVTLPTDRLPDAGGFRVWLTGVVAFLAACALGLVAAAFVVTDNRARILRRVGFWAIGAAAFWLLVGVVLPELARLLLPGQAAILSAIWGISAGSMVDPARFMAEGGLGALVLSGLWSFGSSLARRGGGRAEPGRRERASEQPAQAAQAEPWRRGYEVQRPAPRPAPAPVPRPPEREQSPRWVEGVGYVDDVDPTLPG